MKVTGMYICQKCKTTGYTLFELFICPNCKGNTLTQAEKKDEAKQEENDLTVTLKRATSPDAGEAQQEEH